MFNRLGMAICVSTFAYASNAATVTGDGFEFDYSSNLNAATYSEGPMGVVNFHTSTQYNGNFSIISDYYQSADPADERYLLAFQVSMSVIAPKDIQVRFSYWTIDYHFDVFDASSGLLLKTNSYTVKSGPNIGGWGDGFQIILSTESQPKIRIDANYTFSPGHVLTPSLDPSCQAFSCMTAESDRLEIATAYFSVKSPVPEPSALATLAMGLGAIGFVGQRRMRAKRGANQH